MRESITAAVAIFFIITSFTMALVYFMSSSEGIIPLGDNGNGVLICGEAITLNATPNVTDTEIHLMLDEALIQNREVCARY